MGRGRKGIRDQSLKKAKQKPSVRKETPIHVCGLRSNNPSRPLTPNEIKIAEQLSPQQLVYLLLGE